MEVTKYNVSASCYPRFKNETRRLLDIAQRTDNLWSDTFEKPYPTYEHDSIIKTELQNENLELILYHENRAKQLTGNDMVLQNEGVSCLGSYKYDSMHSFLARNIYLSNTTVMIIQSNNCLTDMILEIPCKKIIVSDSRLQNLPKLEKRYKNYLRVKVSTEDNVAADICSMLESTAFELIKDRFERVKHLLQGKSPFIRERKSWEDVTLEVPVYNEVTFNDSPTYLAIAENIGKKAPLFLQTRKGKPPSSTEETLRREENRKLYEGSSAVVKGDSLQRNKTEKGIKRKLDDFEKQTNITNGYSHWRVSYTDCTSSLAMCQEGTAIKKEGENAWYVRRKRNGKCLSPKEETLQQEAFVNGGSQQTKKIPLGIKGRSHDLGVVNDNSDDLESKFIKNKPIFQRLLGEMFGMYKRSKLPEDLKPTLDVIPKEEISQKMLSDLYNISGSIKGYAYRFCTRLQIFVVEADIEKLKPKIAEILEMHGITQGSYDIVPPIDAVSHYSKLHVGAQVMNETNYGSLTGFVKMRKEQQGEESCAVASKHLLRGSKIVELVNEKRKITADVVPETAPSDDNCMEFDIAVAKIRKDDEKHCDGQFKNESGTFMKGKICSYSDDQLEGQYVHINGASTAKGLGIISMTHFEERKDENEISDPNKELEDNEESSQNEKYIVVEDRVEDAPFCKKGDSGSMVCADDEDGNHVQLISTVIGERTNGSYQTLRLSKAP